MLVLEWKERAFIEKVNSRCFCWFSAAILVHQNCPPIWRLHTKLYKDAWNVSANNSETVGHKDLRLGQIVYILVFYNISFSWFLPLDGFHFIFSLCDSENDLFSGSDYGLRAGVPFLSPSRSPKFPLPLPFLTPATQAIHSRKLSSTRRWAIDSDGVARLVEISSVVKIVLLAMCFLVFAVCLVGCSSTWALRRFSAEPKWYLLLCCTLLWFKRHCLGILQSVDLLWCNSCTFWAVSWISVIDLDW